jgi:hypothetical protein
MEEEAAATIEVAAVKTAAMMAESAKADVTDGPGRDNDSGIVVGTLVCK